MAETALEQLVKSAKNSSLDWELATKSAKSVADGLPTSEQIREDFAKSELLPSLSSLLNNKNVPLAMQIQGFRVIGNLCIDHNKNRNRVLDQDGLLSALVGNFSNILNSNSQTNNVNEEGQGFIAIRSAIGCFLNLVIDSVAVKNELLKDNYNMLTHLFLVCKQTRNVTILDWTLRMLHELLSDESSRSKIPTQSITTLVTIGLCLEKENDDDDEFEERLDVQQLAAELAESVLIDSQLGRTELDQNDDLVNRVLNFISDTSKDNKSQQEQQEHESTLTSIKASLARCIMVSMGDHEDLVTTLNEASKPIERIKTLVSWLDYAPTRNDLLVTACISLANIARNDACSVALEKNFNVIKPLSNLLHYTQSSQAKQDVDSGVLSQGQVTQLAHGVLGLLKHLCIPVVNRKALENSRVVQSSIKVLSSELDVVGPVQASAVGIIKHMSTQNLKISTWMVLGDGSKNEENTPIDQVLSFIKRKDDLRLKSEGTRVIVQIIRSLWDQQQNGNDNTLVTEGENDKRQEAKQKIGQKSQIVDCLYEMLQNGGKYQILINEAIVGLVLVCTSPLREYAVQKLVQEPQEEQEQIKEIEPSLEQDSTGEQQKSSKPKESGVEILTNLLQKEDNKDQNTSSNPSTDNAVKTNAKQLAKIIISTAPTSEQVDNLSKLID